MSVFQELVVVVHKNNIAQEFIFGEDYLALASNNIANHDYGSLSSHTMKNKLFNSLREWRYRALCDSPRKYIWKHVGRNNCAKINIIEIPVEEQSDNLHILEEVYEITNVMNTNTNKDTVCDDKHYFDENVYSG